MRAAMLSRGYLPRELPPPFSSESLGVAYGAISTPLFMATAQPLVTTPVRHNLPRAGLMRRPLAIPDPIRYLLLADSLISTWPQFQSLFTSNSLSLTRPRRDHLGHRAYTFRIDFSSQPSFRARVRAGARYILQADVNQFYPSLYTHAIAWALHTKALAKANRSDALAGNVIDRLVRNGQDGQTMGIPIGPDSSFLIAEALLASFDGNVTSALSNRPGLRMLDEYEFAFDRFTAAEEGIAIIQDELSHFELTLNPRKTRIIEGPVPLDVAWLTALKALPLPNHGSISRQLLTAFIDTAFRLTAEHRGEAILNWALSRLMPLTFSRDQWRLLEPLVLQAAASEPGALPRCLRILLNARRSGLPIDNDGLVRTLSVVTTNAVRRGHGSEASWGVWGHILFGVPLDTSVVNEVQNFDEDVVALVSLDAYHRGLIPRATTFGGWEANVTANGLRDGHWLLSYEATVKNWLRPAANPITGSPAFSDLASRGVSFYRVDNAETLTLAHSHSSPSWMVPPETYLA